MSIIREFHTLERFPLPDCFEIFLANDATGGFEQLAGPFQTEEQAIEVLGAFGKHPDFKSGSKLFIVRVERTPIKGNFNPSDITSRLLVPEKGNVPGKLIQ